MKKTAMILFVLLLLPTVGHAGKEPKKRVAVIEFENQAGKTSETFEEHATLGKGLTDMLVTQLIASNRFIVLDRLHLNEIFREHELIEQGAVHPDVATRLTSAQVLIRGIITHVEATKKEGGRIGIKKIGAVVGIDRKKTRLALIVQLIDVTTGQILQSETVETQMKKRWLSGQLRHKEATAEVKQEMTESVGKVMEKLMDLAVEKIIAGMQSVPWQGHVIKVSGREIIINAGKDSNVETGLELVVYERGEEMIDPQTNESLGWLDEEIGQIRIEQVGDKFAVGKALEGEGFSRGNIVRPVLGASGDLGLTTSSGR